MVIILRLMTKTKEWLWKKMVILMFMKTYYQTKVKICSLKEYVKILFKTNWYFNQINYWDWLKVDSPLNDQDELVFNLKDKICTLKEENERLKLICYESGIQS